MAVIEKQEQVEDQRARLPFRLGYMFIVIIILAFVAKASYAAYNNYEKQVYNVQHDIEQCLFRYTDKKC
jgi:hypothetical protein